MGLKKGQTNNKNGRPKGALNKIGGPLKEQIGGFLQDKIAEFPKIWLQLSARDKAGLIVDLLPFVLPKIASVEMDASIVNYSALSEKQIDEIALKISQYEKGNQ